MNSMNDTSIVMTGASEGVRKMATMLINQTLEEHGFVNINVVDCHGKEMSLAEYVPTILELIQRNSPKLFNSTVTVQEVKIRTVHDDNFFVKES